MVAKTGAECESSMRIVIEQTPMESDKVSYDLIQQLEQLHRPAASQCY
jgi:hypothetical protein